MKQESEYIKKIKRRMIIIGILVVTVFTTISFGFYYMGASQKGESGVSSITCFDMDFKDGDSINLTNAVSISDELGLKTNPYHFKIENNCDTEVNYYVILNVKDNSFSDDFISVSLNGKNPRVLSSKKENTQFDKPAGYTKSYILQKGTLTKGNPKEYDTRLWINADATYENVQGKSWEAQIKVVSTVKELEDEILAQGIPNEMMARVDNDKFWQHSSNIKTATFENTLNPKENAAYTYDVSELQDGSVMSYLVPNAEDSSKYDLYIHADGKIIANPDCSSLFDDFYLTDIEGLEFFDTSNVTTMAWMFSGSGESLDLSLLDTSNVTNMCSMFYNSQRLKTLNINSFDTSNVTNMAGMFGRCNDLTILDLSSFDTSNVTNMAGMFEDCWSLTELDLSNFDTSNVTSMYSMFRGCSNLMSLNVSNFNIKNVTNMRDMFSGCRTLTMLNLSSFGINKVTNMSFMFFSCNSLTTLDISNLDTSNVINMGSMFDGCNSLTTLDVSKFNTSHVTSMYSMFRGCSSLASLNVSNFDTSNSKSMAGMFSGCSGLTTLNVSNFNTSNVTDMSWMFSGCSGLTTLNISNFDTSNVTNIGGMFSGCSGLTTLDVSNFNTSNVTNMVYMFSGCSGLTTLDVSNFNTSNVTTMQSMFNMYNFNDPTSSKLAEIKGLENFDTSKVTNMMDMFYLCDNLTTLDLSNFDTSNVTNMADMFNNCSNLTTTITIRGTKCTSYNNMFKNAATNSGASITINYTEDASSLVDNMIATKSSNSNVVKGTQVV